MEMEVVMPVQPVDFNFDSTCSSPYMTAPSSPQRFGNFLFSAPTSPTRISSFYREFKDVTLSTNSSSSSSIPFNWEEKPGTPKSKNQRQDNSNNNKKKNINDDYNEDFEFNFSGQLEERTSLSAEELFDGGKIKPLKPPPGYDSTVSSPRSPRSPRTTNKKGFDPFQAAIEETRRREVNQQDHHQRGRGRSFGGGSFSGPLRKGSRSLSPLRVSDVMFDEEDNSNSQNAKSNSSTTTNTPKSSSSYTASFFSAISFTSKRYKKWKLKDLLLFRSASEGSRTTTRCDDPEQKYAVLSKKEIIEDVKNASFRSTDSVGSSRRRGSVSAHEIHYTVNRAASEEMRRKTFLPYKQGLLGCLGFNPAASVNEISRSVGSLTRG